MSTDDHTATCPACGERVVPPAGAQRFFCPSCGHPLTASDVAIPADDVQGTLQVAEDHTLDALQQAVDLMQSGAPVATIQAAIDGARQAVEALRAARQAQRCVADAQRHVPAQDATPPQNAAPPQDATPTQDATPPQERRRPQDGPVEYRRGVAVRNASSGHGLFYVTLPSTWKIEDATLRQGRSGSQPYDAYARFTDDAGASMILELGDAGVRNSAGMDAAMAQYGHAIASIDRNNYAPMPGPRRTADNQATKIIQDLGGTNTTCICELGGLNLAKRQQEARETFTRAAQQTGPVMLRDPFAAEMIRIYAFNRGDIPYKAAVYVRIYAIKDASGVDMMNPLGLVAGLGSLIGGRTSRVDAGKAASPAPQASAVAGSDGRPFSTSSFESYTKDGTIYWNVFGISTLMARASQFDKAYAEAFLPFVSEFQAHGDLLNLQAADARRQAAAMQQATNIEVNRMNMQTQAALAANRQVQAAADARFESWQRQSDAHHAAFRERTNAPFSTAAGASVGDFSEAIRGVNTYTTSDGREVEVGVWADRAYENQAGDVIGGSGGFEPGADWTEIPRS